MTPDKISQTVLFPDLFDKPLVATFKREQASSDGGAVLLKAAERVYGLVKAFAVEAVALGPPSRRSGVSQARRASTRRSPRAWGRLSAPIASRTMLTPSLTAVRQAGRPHRPPQARHGCASDFDCCMPVPAVPDRLEASSAAGRLCGPRRVRAPADRVVSLSPSADKGV